MSRTTRTLQALATGYIGSIITMSVGFAVTPLIVRTLGQEGYGAYQTLLSYLAFLALFDAALTGSTHFVLSRAVTSSAPNLASVVGTIARSYARLTFIYLAVIGVLATLMPVIVNTVPEVSQQLRYSLIFSAIGAFLLPLQAFRPLADARQRGFISNIGNTLMALSNSIGGWLLVGMGTGIPGLFAALVIGQAVNFFILWLDSRSLVNSRDILHSPVDATTRNDIRKTSGWSLFCHFLSRLSTMADMVIIGFMLGSATVTPMVLTGRLAGAVLGQLFTISNSTWASLAELHYMGLHERFNIRLVQLTRVISFLGLALMLPVAVGTSPFVRAWVGPANDAGMLIAGLSGLSAWSVSIFTFWVTILNGTGHIRSLIPLLTVGTIASLGLSLILTPIVGMPGPLLGTMFQAFVLNLWGQPRLLTHHFGTPYLPVIQAVLRPLLLALILAAGLFPLAAWIPWERWCGNRATQMIAAVALMGIVSVIYSALGWFFVISASERQELKDRLFRRKKAPNTDTVS